MVAEVSLIVPKSRLKHQRDWALAVMEWVVYESCHSVLSYWGFIVFWFTQFNVLFFKKNVFMQCSALVDSVHYEYAVEIKQDGIDLLQPCS